MQRLTVLSLTVILCLGIAVVSFAQNPKEKYRIDLKLFRTRFTQEEMHKNSLPKFVVTVTNLGANKMDFGDHLSFSYKSYRDQDYYLEAVDMNGKYVNIDGYADIDHVIDPFDMNTIHHFNKIVDTISTGIYTLKQGKYRIRWVYDPANNQWNGHSSVPAPIYSNWEVIEITK